jgi:predicted membrane channel-forming protein YqfA (hemolysin III family)
MKSQRFLKFRIVVSVAMGVFLLIESTNANFLRPAVESRAIFVHIVVALLGAAFLVQAAILGEKVTRKTLS